MRYRIKITTYANGRKSFLAQYKSGVFWMSLFYDGSISIIPADAVDTRERALDRIDKHYAGNMKKHFIEFEYITKTKTV